MKRVRLVRVRRCARCGRAGAELRTDDGDQLVVALDPVHARLLAGGDADVRPLADTVLERLAHDGAAPSELVIDVAAGALCGLLSLVRGGATDVVVCPAGEGVTLAVRGKLAMYATDDAVAHAVNASRPAGAGGAGGPETLH